MFKINTQVFLGVYFVNERKKNFALLRTVITGNSTRTKVFLSFVFNARYFRIYPARHQILLYPHRLRRSLRPKRLGPAELKHGQR